MYDSTKLVKVDGTVTNFQWTNPHVLLWVTGTSAPGEAPTLWTIELPTSPGNLGRMGWTKHSLKGGDHVIVELNPLRDGKHGGSFKKATLDSGKILLANPLSTSADGGANYGPDDTKAAANSTDAPKKGRFGCAMPASVPPGDASAALLLSLGFGIVLRRRRRTALTRDTHFQ